MIELSIFSCLDLVAYLSLIQLRVYLRGHMQDGSIKFLDRYIHGYIYLHARVYIPSKQNIDSPPPIAEHTSHMPLQSHLLKGLHDKTSHNHHQPG